MLTPSRNALLCPKTTIIVHLSLHRYINITMEHHRRATKQWTSDGTVLIIDPVKTRHLAVQLA